LNNPFRDFDGSPEVIRMFVKTDVRFPLSLRKLKMSSPRCSRLVDRFGTTRPFAVSTARVDVKRTLQTALRMFAARQERKDRLAKKNAGVSDVEAEIVAAAPGEAAALDLLGSLFASFRLLER
jgi:hypothetical protein